MSQTIFTGGRVLSPAHDRLIEGAELRVGDNCVRNVSDMSIASSSTAEASRWSGGGAPQRHAMAIRQSWIWCLPVSA